MPFLMVNLDDPRDCRRGLQQLREMTERHGPRREGRDGPTRCGEEPLRGRRHHRRENFGGGPPAGEADLHALPEVQKLMRIRQRGIWKHLQRVATQVKEPLSLPEMDQVLGLSRNKMRSLKAIMGKLERRWGLVFLVPDPNGSVDVSGNPRYVMPAELRARIVRLSE
ncbi:MAG: hypothetical protein R3B90_10665 [Planctomycetaceae bacterium]